MPKMFLGECMKKVVVHVKLHLDELVAMWLLLCWGQEAFPGIETAEMETSGIGGDTSDGRPAEEWEREGVLYIGTGRGRFDEHREGCEDKCCALLVAEALGIEDDPALIKLLEFTTKEDAKGENNPLGLASIIKAMHRNGKSVREILKWASQGLETIYQDQERFSGPLAEEYAAKARIVPLPSPGPDGKPMVACLIQSDMEGVDRYARSKKGCSAAIVLLKNSKGQIQIFANKKYPLRFDDLVVMVRLEEQMKAGGKPKITDWKLLAAYEKVEGIEAWFYHKGGFLLNGSTTAPDVLPTKLTLDEILKLALIAFSPEFNPAHAAACQQGKCTASSMKFCLLYKYGLQRCRQIRYEQRAAQSDGQTARNNRPDHPRDNGRDHQRRPNERRQPQSGKTCTIVVKQ